MAEKIAMPQLGESVTEGTISKWLVKVGDFVKKYEPLCEVSTDKVNAEVPSSVTGTITEIIVQEGDTVGVGALICSIETNESQPSVAQVQIQENKTEHNTGEVSKMRFSPAVLKLAQEHQVDLSLLEGTGAGGRVTRKDVLAFLDQKSSVSTKINQSTYQVEKEKPSVASPAYSSQAADQVIPASAVRKTIASRMVQSKHEAPHAWTMVECDVTNLVSFRERIKDEFKEKEGVSLTYLPFFIKAVVEALKEYPILNSQWVDDQIIIKKSIHISIAVATEEALYVPVIKDADQRSILGIAKSIQELAQKTRQGKLSVDDMSGGTFTVNNTGSFGSVLSAPIINYPQAAILSVESIVKRPVVINGMIGIRDMVNLCLSLDHRILDGLVCGKFLQSVKQKLENYGPETKLY